MYNIMATTAATAAATTVTTASTSCKGCLAWSHKDFSLDWA